MKLPKTVKIGPITYKVKTKKDLRNGDDKQLYGQYVANNGCIYLDEDIPDNRARSVLLHEIFHGMWAGQSLYKTEYAKHEEEIVSLMATMMMQFLQDNKELVKELSK